MDKYEGLRNLNPLTVLNALWVDISTFKKRSGKQEWYGRCPMPGHNPKHNTTSFSVNLDGRFQCFGCQAKGRGSIDLTKLIRNCGFQEATEFLSGCKPSPSLENKPINDSVKPDEALKPFTGTYHQHQIKLPWLEARCPNKDIRELYGVFAYSNPARKSKYQNKVFIPLKDLEGTLYGYLIRTPEPKEGESKYEFPSGFPKSRFLFGAAELKAGRFGGVPLRYVVAVESPFAVMRLASLGVPAVSLYGWAVSEEQAALIASIARACLYLPDRNKHSEGLHTLVPLSQRIWVKAPTLPDGVNDAEYLTREQIQALVASR